MKLTIRQCIDRNQDPDQNKSQTPKDWLQIWQYGKVMIICCARRHDLSMKCSSVNLLHKNRMKDISDSVDSDDEIEIILIVLIIAFSADFLDLVEKIHL